MPSRLVGWQHRPGNEQKNTYDQADHAQPFGDFEPYVESYTTLDVIVTKKKKRTVWKNPVRDRTWYAADEIWR